METFTLIVWSSAHGVWEQWKKRQQERERQNRERNRVREKERCVEFVRRDVGLLCVIKR